MKNQKKLRRLYLERAELTFLAERPKAASVVLGRLEYRDDLVLSLYFGLRGDREHTLEEIGSLLGVSSGRIRQIRDRALLRARAETKELLRESEMTRLWLGGHTIKEGEQE